MAQSLLTNRSLGIKNFLLAIVFLATTWKKHDAASKSWNDVFLGSAGDLGWMITFEG